MSNISKQVTIKKDEKTEITYFSKQCPIDDSIPYDTVNGLTVSYANTNLETSQFISIPTYIDMDSALGDMFPTNGRPNPCHCNGVPLVSKVPDDFEDKYTAITDVKDCIVNGVGFNVLSKTNKIYKDNFLWINGVATEQHISGKEFSNFVSSDPVATYIMDVVWSVPVHIEILGIKYLYKNGRPKASKKYKYKYRQTLLFNKKQRFFVCRDRLSVDNTTVTGYTYKKGRIVQTIGTYSQSKQLDTNYQWDRTKKTFGSKIFDVHHLGLAYAMDSDKFEKTLEKILAQRGNIITTFPRLNSFLLRLKDEDLKLQNTPDLGFYSKSTDPVTDSEVNGLVGRVKTTVETAVNSFLLYGPYRGYHERKDWKDRVTKELEHDMYDSGIRSNNLPITDKLASYDESSRGLKNIKNRLVNHGLSSNNTCDFYIYHVPVDDIKITTGDTIVNSVKLIRTAPTLDREQDVPRFPSKVTFLHNTHDWDYEELDEYLNSQLGPDGGPDSDIAAYKDDIKNFVSSTSDVRAINTYLETLTSAAESSGPTEVADAIYLLDAKKIQKIKNNDHLQGSWEYEK
jgi:hypothetical protein